MARCIFVVDEYDTVIYVQLVKRLRMNRIMRLSSMR